MKVKLETFANGDLLIRLPLALIDHLQLKLGDTVTLDVPTVYPNQFIVYKESK
jgi:hypothetical protein